MKKLILALMIIVICMGFLHDRANAAKTLQELKKEQSELKSKERETEESLRQVRSEKSSLTNDVTALNLEIELCENQLAYIHSRLDQTRYELDITETELETAETERANHYEALKKRLKYIQEYGEIGYVQVLFKSKSVGDFLNRLEYVNDIITYDQSMYQNLEEIEETIAEKKDVVEVQLRSVEVLLMEEEEKMVALEQTKDAKEILLREIEEDEDKFNQQLQEFKDESEALGEKIREAQAAAEKAAREAAARAAASGGRLQGSRGTGQAPTGQFHWPVPGYYSLSSGYKNRTNPITGRAEFHTGIDIPAPRGTNIVAAEGGTVILAGSNGGYGICVVIDHGNGVSTLYGHNSSLVVSVGDYVDKGQTIAKCGSTGMSTGNHCHFEVRINGSPNNPGPYVGI